MEDSKKWRFTRMEVKKLLLLFGPHKSALQLHWKTKRMILIMISFTPFLKAHQRKFSSNLKIVCFKYHGKRQSKTLLHYHQTIVKQLFNLQCVSFCVSPNSKRMPTTYIICHFYTSPSVECFKASLEPLVSRHDYSTKVQLHT